MIAGCGLLTYACNTIVTFEDASNDPRFSRLIGTDHQSTEELMIYGITVERYHAPILDHYTVTTLPGIGGREVLSQHRLAIGTTCSPRFYDVPIAILILGSVSRQWLRSRPD